MGLGVGIDCEVCGEQLCYGTDTAEIVRHSDIDEDGRTVIIRRPVLCHECVTRHVRVEELKHDQGGA